MQRLFLALAAALLMGVFGCGTGGLRSTGRTAMDPDQALEAEVYTRLSDDSGAYPAGLAVEARDGVVTVFGSAGNPAEQARALAVVRSTPGVTRVIVATSR